MPICEHHYAFPLVITTNAGAVCCFQTLGRYSNLGGVLPESGVPSSNILISLVKFTLAREIKHPQGDQWIRQQQIDTTYGTEINEKFCEKCKVEVHKFITGLTHRVRLIRDDNMHVQKVHYQL